MPVSLDKAQYSDPASAQSALDTWQQNDAESGGNSFQQFMTDASKGKGNDMIEDIVNAGKAGDLSKEDMAALGAQAQQTANAHGKGVINDAEHNLLSDALGGTNVIANGKTASTVGFEKFLKNYTPLGGMMGSNKGTHDLVQLGANAESNAVNQAMTELQTKDPAAYNKLMSTSAKDGNSMIDALVSAKGKVSDQTIGVLAGQVQKIANQNGGGVINDAEHGKLKDAIGIDTITNGQTRAEQGFDKFAKVFTEIASVVAAVAAAVVAPEMLGLEVAGEAAAAGGAASEAAGAAGAAGEAAGVAGETAGTVSTTAAGASEGATSAASNASSLALRTGREIAENAPAPNQQQNQQTV